MDKMLLYAAVTFAGTYIWHGLYANNILRWSCFETAVDNYVMLHHIDVVRLNIFYISYIVTCNIYMDHCFTNVLIRDFFINLLLYLDIVS